MKKPVESVVEEQTYITRIETRYIEDGKRTRSREFVPKFESDERKQAILGKQLRGETPTEPWDRTEEDHAMTRATSSAVEKWAKNR